MSRSPFHVRIWLTADEELGEGLCRVRIDSPIGRAEGVISQEAFDAFRRAVKPTAAEVYGERPARRPCCLASALSGAAHSIDCQLRNGT